AHRTYLSLSLNPFGDADRVVDFIFYFGQFAGDGSDAAMVVESGLGAAAAGDSENGAAAVGVDGVASILVVVSVVVLHIEKAGGRKVGRRLGERLGSGGGVNEAGVTAEVAAVVDDRAISEDDEAIDRAALLACVALENDEGVGRRFGGFGGLSGRECGDRQHC